MARMCTFNDVTFSNQSLTACWNTCLTAIDSYAGISSIAQRSLSLLHQSAQHLVPIRGSGGDSRHGVKEPLSLSSHDSIPQNVQHGDDSGDWGHPIRRNPAADSTQEGDRLGAHIVRPSMNGDFAGVAPSLDPYFDFVLPPDLDDNVWDGDMVPSGWAFVPSTDPMEMFDPPFDM